MCGQGGGGRSGIDGEFRVGRCKILHLEWMSNEVLLHSIGNYVQSLEAEHMEDGMRDILYIFYIYIYKTGSLCYTAEIDTTL